MQFIWTLGSMTKCNLGLGFLWKFNVVMGLYGLKNLRGEGRLVGSRERYQSDLTP
jgi:hypothetical protein